MSTFDEQEPRHDLRAVPDEHHPSPDEGVEQLEREAAATRAELGETVDALAAKLDVRTRAKHGADEQKARVQHAVANVRRSATDREGSRCRRSGQRVSPRPSRSSGCRSPCASSVHVADGSTGTGATGSDDRTS